jgi:sporulation protein YlmC with PRC-barrel domain
MAEPPVDLKLEIDESDIVELEIVKPSQHVIVNTANYFFTSEKYKVHNELINWCQVEAVKAGFTIVIEKSDNSYGRRKHFFIGL